MESLLVLPTLHSLNNSTYHHHQPIFDFSNNSSRSSSSVKTMSESDVELVEEALMKLPNIKTRSQRLFWPFLGDDNNKEKENDSFVNDGNNQKKERKEEERTRVNRQKEQERKRTGRQRCSIDRPQFCRRRGNNGIDLT
jgi:hypothetical protein